MSSVPMAPTVESAVPKNFWLVRIGSILIAVGLALVLDVMARGFSGLLESRMMTLACLYITLAVSLNLVNGITGQFSIGHAGFFQVGAYTAAIVSRDHMPPGINPILWIAMMAIAGAGAAALFGIVVGLPSLRLRGDYLAIVTLGFGEIARILVNTQPQWGGSYGTNLGNAAKNPSVFLAALLAMGCIGLCRNLLKNAHGLPFLAIREDEVAASAMGIKATTIKVTAFAIGSAFAGAAGAIFAHTEGFIAPKSFGMDLSFMILTMVVLGGSGSITGSAILAVILFYLPEALRDAPAVSAPMLAGILVLILLLTAAAKKMEDVHGDDRKKRWLSGLAVSIGLGVAVAVALNFVPQLAGTRFESVQLRMVIFAIALIISMLLRPQGIFAHHEFSWTWLNKVLHRRAA